MILTIYYLILILQIKKKYYYKFASVYKKKDNPIPFKNSLRSFNILETRSISQAQFIFFSFLIDYQYYYKIISNLPPKYVYSLLSIDLLASKSTMYKILKQNSSISQLYKYCPRTYILDDPQDIVMLKSEFTPRNAYIIKKNLQRQTGCKITNNLNLIMNSSNEQYVVCQRMLGSPYLIGGHKINLRQYLLLIVDKRMKAYLYNDGFVYYTPKQYQASSLEQDRNITTGYIDRRIYDKYPMTVKELYNYIGIDHTNKLKIELQRLFEYIVAAYRNIIESNDGNKHTNFVVLGCDVAVHTNLDCKIMEINKGPDLSYKDERDKKVKQNMILDVFQKIGIIKHSTTNNFVLIK